MTSIDNKPNGHVEQKSTEQKEPQSKEGPQEKQKPKRERTKKAPKESLNDPMKIIEAILANSSFKEPNLSKIVEEKFYEAPDYKATVQNLLKNVKYKSTIGSIDIDTSVLPEEFSGHIELPVKAITELSCVNSETKKRKWPKKGRRRNKNNKNNNNSSNNNNNKNSNQDNNNSKSQNNNKKGPSIADSGNHQASSKNVDKKEV